VGDQLRAIFAAGFGHEDVLLSQCHHNCLMTKHPGYSSATLWHQDIRYWSFDRPELVSVWLALGSEDEKNGALKVIPGSHLLELDRGRLDSALFLRTELEENQTLLASAQSVPLEPGDVLFFHCRLFHAAGMNLTDQVKQSLVFTYHAADNRPIPETRSALLPSIPLQRG
jgi:phytanoyl-CoA hydroxylase